MAQFDKYGRVRKDSIGSPSNSSGEDDKTSIVLLIVYYIIAGLIFYFYAWDEMGIGWGLLYSLFWPISIPIMWLFG